MRCFLCAFLFYYLFFFLLLLLLWYRNAKISSFCSYISKKNYKQIFAVVGKISYYCLFVTQQNKNQKKKIIFIFGAEVEAKYTEQKKQE